MRPYLFRIRTHLNALREAMTGRDDGPTKKAVHFVDIKPVFCMLSSSSRLVDHFVIFVALLGKSAIQSREPRT